MEKTFERGQRVVSLWRWYDPSFFEGFVACEAQEDPLHDYVLVASEKLLDQVQSENDLDKLTMHRDFEYRSTRFIYRFSPKVLRLVRKAAGFYHRHILSNPSSWRDPETIFTRFFAHPKPWIDRLRIAYFTRSVFIFWKRLLDTVIVGTFHLLLLDPLQFYITRHKLRDKRQELKNLRYQGSQLRNEISRLAGITGKEIQSDNEIRIQDATKEVRNLEEKLSGHSRGTLALVIAVLSLIIAIFKI